MASSPAVPAGVKFVERMTPDDMIRRAYAEKIYQNDKTRLTWNPERPPQVPDDRMRGEVNLNLPYQFIERKVFYQNSRFYLSNGERTSLGYISQTFPEIWKKCVDAKECMDREAAQRDPLLCKHCYDYRALDPDDYHEHIVKLHADKVLGSLVPASEEVPDPPPPQATAADPEALLPPTVAAPASFDCKVCGKHIRTRTALGSHMRVHKSGPSS